MHASSNTSADFSCIQRITNKLFHDSVSMCKLRFETRLSCNVWFKCFDSICCHFSGVFSKLYDKLPPTRKVLHYKTLPVPIYIMGVNGVKNSHIVLKAWFLACSFLRPREKFWFRAQAKLTQLTSQWRHNEVKCFNYDVTMTSYNVIFACAPNQKFFPWS